MQQALYKSLSECARNCLFKTSQVSVPFAPKGLLMDAHRSIDSSIPPLTAFYFVDSQSVYFQRLEDSIPRLLVEPIGCSFSSAGTIEQSTFLRSTPSFVVRH